MLTETPAPILSEQLRSDEKLLWYGRPNALRMARSRLTPVAFGAFWTVFVFFMYNTAQNNFFNRRSNFGNSFSSDFSGFQSIFSLVLIVFIGIGIWMMLTPVRNYIKALNTYYGVTDKRAIIISKLFSTTIISYTKRDIRSIRRVAYGDGTGDVVFGYDSHTYTDYNTNNQQNTGGININFGDDGGVHVGSGSVRRTVTTAIGFFGIPDHQMVEDLMVKTFAKDEEK